MTSALKKSSVFVRPHVHTKTAFSKRSTPESVFEKFVFIENVWTEAGSLKKTLRLKTDTCGRGLSKKNI